MGSVHLTGLACSPYKHKTKNPKDSIEEWDLTSQRTGWKVGWFSPNKQALSFLLTLAKQALRKWNGLKILKLILTVRLSDASRPDFKMPEVSNFAVWLCTVFTLYSHRKTTPNTRELNEGCMLISLI